MRPGACTPEELEMLLEDAQVLRDHDALAALFGAGATLADGTGQPARGGDAITCLALATRQGERTYVAHPRRVVQAGDVALVVGERGVNVVRRERDGGWRHAIVQLRAEDHHERNTTMTQDIGLRPLAVAAGQGEARWWFSSLAVVKATAADTGGLLSILEITEPPGMQGSLHVRHREDEGFWILDGEATFEFGGTVTEARAGEFVFGSRDIPHRYSVGDAGCRMLFIMTPGGFEELVIAMSEPAASRALPPSSDVEPDWVWVAAIARAHGAELLG
jgi:mannose-6-phosphate isomerase-like protein (cupin superfamily)